MSITVDPLYDEPIDRFEIDWGDDSEITVVPGSKNPEDQFHVYDLSDFFGTCSYSIDDFGVRLETYLVDGTKINNAFFPSFKNPPTAIIGNNQSTVCVGEEICFDSNSCPTETLEIVSWDFGDGTPPGEANCHSFSAPGTYVVALTVRNDCDTDIALDTIQVIDQATAVGLVLDGTENPGTLEGPYQVCLDGGDAIVSLNGSNDSANETSYFWEVISGNDFQWILPEGVTQPSIPSIQIRFLEVGTYQIVLETDNACNLPARDTLTFEVAGGAIELDPQADGCVSLDYTPAPLQTNVVYSINGNPVSDFPVTLDPGTYVVTATGGDSFCATMPLMDTFLVLTQEIAEVLTPDTTICSLDGAFVFDATPANGNWTIDGAPFSGMLDPTDYSAGTYTIEYGNDPCITTDQITFTIVDADIDMPEATEVCIDGGSVTFAATPSGGVWSGTGINSAGSFDPMLAGVGTYQLFYTLENEALPSCSNIDSFEVTVSDLMLDFAVADCAATQLCFELVNSSDYNSITWDFGGTGSSTAGMPCHTFPDPGSYPITATIVNGPCTTARTRTITIEAPPVSGFNLDYDPDLCSPLSISFSDQSFGSNLIYEWTLNDSVFATSPNPGPLELEALGTATTYEIGLRVRNDCAVDASTETLIVRPRPVSRFGTDQNQYCSGDTIPIRNVSIGVPTTYRWVLDGETISTDSMPPTLSHQTAVTDTLNLCLIATNDCGADTTCLDLEIVPTDVDAFFNTDPTNVCAGDTVRFANLATPNVPVFYTFGDGNDTSIPSPSHVYSEPGTYTVTQQAFGCGFDSFSQNITVSERPFATWNHIPSACPGDTLFFQNTSEGVMRYAWDFGDSTSVSELRSPSHAYSTPGNYTVCLSVFAPGTDSCVDRRCRQIAILMPPEAGFTLTDSLCLATNTNFLSQASGIDLQCDYYFGDGNLSGDCNPSHTYAAAGTYSATQIVTDVNGCRDTFVQQVFIRALPQPAFTFSTDRGCHPDSVYFDNLSTNADAYLWDFGDGATSTLTAPVHFYDQPGSYSVTLTALVDGLCSATSTSVVTLSESPRAEFSIDAQRVCVDSPVRFTSTSTGPVNTTLWDFGDDQVSFEAEPTHLYTTPGSYTPTLIVNYDGMCPDTAQLQLIVSPSVTGSIAGQDIECNGSATGSINLELLSGTPPYNYSWSDGASTEDRNNLPAGDYSVSVTDFNGCVWTEALELTQPAALDIDVATTRVTCFGGSDGRLAVTPRGGFAPYNLNWETGATDSVLTGIPAGSYELTLSDERGCEEIFTVMLEQNDPIGYRDSVQNISCFGANDGVIQFNEVTGGVEPYDIQVTGNEYTAGGLSITRFDGLSPGNYAAAITDALGCTEQFSTSIIEPDSIFVDIERDTYDIVLGQAIELTTLYNAGDPVFTWFAPNDPGSLDCADCPAPFVRPFRSERYTVILSDGMGCTALDTAFVRVLIDREVYLPNTFSPNGDGRNDSFRVRIRSEDSVEAIAFLRVFDRWGELLFEVTDVPPEVRNHGWDGTFRGTPVEPGVYVYHASVHFVDGEREERKGELLLIR